MSADQNRPLDGECTAPVLPSADLARTATFYGGLGFLAAFPAPGHDYLIVRKGWIEFHFFLHPENDPLRSAHGCYVRLSDVDAALAGFGEGLPRQGTPRYHPIEDKPWGMRQAALIDPDGNLIQFGSRLPQGA